MSKIVYEVTVGTDKTEWRLNGKYHREDGPAVVYSNGKKEWHRNGKRHREGGPAIECVNGTTKWYINGKQHREDGPAMKCKNGDKYWYLDDISYTQAEFKIEIAKRKDSCNGKVVEIDGKKYELKEMS